MSQSRLALVFGEGSQCAMMTASGATIAAAVACFDQKSAIAGVAAFARVVSNKMKVGRYAAYFFKRISPSDSSAVV